MIKKKTRPDPADTAPDQAADPSVEAPLREVLSESEVGGGKPPRTRVMLLLLLLLAALGGAAYYLYFPSPEPPAAVKSSPPARQPIAIPEKPAGLDQPEPRSTASADTQERTEPETRTGQEGSLKEASTAVPAEGSEPREKSAAVLPEGAQPAAEAEKAEVLAKKETATEEVKGADTQPAVQANVQAPPPAPRFTLNAGAFLLNSSLDETQRVARPLGYEIHLDTVDRPVEMIRLRIGEFSPEEARAKITELADAAPDAFLVHGEGGATVYAASYFDLDQARSFADRLFLKGVRVEEETVRVQETLTLVNIGTFSDRASAEKAARDARRAGLDVRILSVR